MNSLLTAFLFATILLGCIQPDNRLHSRRCQTESCKEAKKKLEEKKATPVEEPVPETAAEEPLSTEPQEVKDQISSDRRYFQSRSVISLRPTDEALGLNDEFSLVNATSKKTLIARQAVATSVSLYDSVGFYQLQESSNDIVLQLFPVLGVTDEQFSYGQNNLRLWINSQAGQRYSLIEIWLKDFDIMGLTSATIRNDEEHGGLEGWVNSVNNPYVSEDGQMVVGVHNIVND